MIYSTGLTYALNTDENSYAITGIGSCTDTAINIPPTYNGKDVTKINDWAFYQGENLTSIIIPDSVIEIGASAFRECTSITTVTIGNKVTNIGRFSFADCKKIQTINIPNSVTTIGHDAFRMCSSLKTVIIGTGVTNIGDNTFFRCNALESITLPFVGATKDELKNTHFSYIFGSPSYQINKECVPNTLKEVIITGSGKIGAYAFSNCSMIEKIQISNDINYINFSAFSGCSNLKEIKLPFTGSSLTSDQNVHFGYIFGATTFNENNRYIPTSLKKITLTNTLFIPNNAFKNCASIEEIIFEKDLISIGEAAFSNCQSIKSIDLSTTLKSIGAYAFSNCSQLEVIEYNGTLLEWSTIEFGYNWNPNTYCIINYIDGSTINNTVNLYRVELVNGTINGTSDSVGVFIENSSISIRPNEAPEGYDFKGWTSDGESIISNYWDYTFNVIEDIKYTALFAPSYNIEVVNGVINQTGNPIDSFLENTEIDLVVEEPEGYEFSHWEDDTGEIISTEPSVKITVTKNATYYARCIIKSYEINITGGTINDETSLIINHGTTITLIANEPQENYIFSHWENNNGDNIGTDNILEYSITQSDTYTAVFQLAVSDGLTYSSSDTFRVVTGIGTCTDTEIIIPAIWNGLPVTEISGRGFQDCTNLTSIIIPDSITDICDRAFYGCSSLTSVTIGNSVTSIGDRAFYDCSSLTSITIPDSVTSIGKWAFSGCVNLRDIKLSSNLLIINEGLFNDCESLNNIIIPDSVTDIYSGSFYNCRNLTSITLGTNLTTIHESEGFPGDAFGFCDKLMEIYNLSSLPLTLRSPDYGYIAFYAKVIHNSLSEPSNLFIDENNYQFYEDDTTCYLMGYLGDDADLILPLGCHGERYKIYDYACYQNNNITKVKITSGAITIGMSAFAGCRNLMYVTLDDGVEGFNGRAFRNCSSLLSINIPNSIEGFLPFDGAEDFEGCINLLEVINNSSLSIEAGSNENGMVAKYALEVHMGESKLDTSIDDYIFYTTDENVHYLVKYIGTEPIITLPEDYLGESYQIYKYAFSNNIATNITIPAKVTDINILAFNNCTNLSYIEINESNQNYTSIDGIIYDKNCSSIYFVPSALSSTTVIIPEDVEEIQASAFKNCTSLINIHIPKNIKTIGENAFEGCENILHTYVYDLNTWINCNFGNDHSYPNKYGILHLIDNEGKDITSITIPDTMTKITGNLFTGCYNLEQVIIPNSITEIDELSFSKCIKLIEIYNLSDLNITCGSSDNGRIGYNALSIHTSLEEDSNLISIDNYTLFKKETECRLLHYDGTDSELVLPISFDGIDTYKIWDYAFYNHVELLSIDIPSSVTYIGTAAFSGCSNLNYIKIPFIGNQIKNMDATYQYPLGVIFGTVPYENSLPIEQKYIGEYNWGNTETTTYHLPGNLKSVEVSNGIIVSGAFYNCTMLDSIILGEGVLDTCEESFYNCNQLIQIENGISYIDKWVIGSDENLTNAVLREDTQGIGYEAFASIYSLESVTIPDSVHSIGTDAFRYSDLPNIDLPTNLKYLGPNAFYWCDFTSIIIPEGLTSISSGCFTGNTNLNTIVLPKSLTHIYASAFRSCSNLYNVYYSDTEDEFNIDVEEDGNDSLLNATWFWYSENKCDVPNTWHWKDGVPDIWVSIIKYEDISETTCKVSEVLISSQNECFTIPSLNNKNQTVVSIGTQAFQGQLQLKEIIIPAEIESIESYAFKNCINLSTIRFLNNTKLTSIGVGAFDGCSQNLNSSVYLTDLTSWLNLDIPQDENDVVARFLYLNSASPFIGQSELYLNNERVSNLIIPEGIKEIKPYAFTNVNIDTIEFPSTLETIGKAAFVYSGLKSVAIPDNVKTIQEAAFGRCVNVTEIFLGKSLSSIESYSFAFLPNLAKIYFNCENLTFDPQSEIVISPFYGCGRCKNYMLNDYDPVTDIELIIGYTVRSICDDLFSGSLNKFEDPITSQGPNLRSIIFKEPSQCTYIGARAFRGNERLINVTIPPSVITIGEDAFIDCLSLIINNNIIINDRLMQCTSDTADLEIIIPDGVVNIENSVFKGKSIKSIEIQGNNLKYIGADAFKDLTRPIESIKVENLRNYFAIDFGNEYSNPWRFMTIESSNYNPAPLYYTSSNRSESYDALLDNKNIIISNRLNHIGNYAFYNRTDIESIYIQEGATSIGDYAFNGCSNLQYSQCNLPFTIPNSVSYIGKEVFTNCNNLITIIDNNLENVDGWIIGSNDSAISSVDLHDISIKGIASEAFSNCSFLNSINIYPNLNGAGDNVFIGCDNIKTATIPPILLPSLFSDELENLLIVGSGNIPNEALKNNPSLVELIIDPTARINNIGFNSFSGCANLARLVIPEGSVNSINASAFSGCTNLMTVTIPNHITAYLHNLSNLNQVTIWGNGKILNGSFNNCPNLNSVTLGKNISALEYNTFRNCNLNLQFYLSPGTSLIDETDKGYIKNIDGSYYFKSNSDSITIPHDVDNYLVPHNLSPSTIIVENNIIPDYAFADNNNLTNLSFNFSKGIDKLGIDILPTIDDENYHEENNGYYITNVDGSIHTLIKVKDKTCTSFTIQDGTKIIYSNAFKDCENLSTIEFPSSLEQIYPNAFENCKNLINITLPSNAKYLGHNILNGCTKLESLTLPFIGGDQKTNQNSFLSYLFGNKNYYAENYIPETLKTVTINSVNFISEFAFYKCKTLESIIINNVVNAMTKISRYAFVDCNNLTTLRLPNNSYYIESCAFLNCSNTLEIIGIDWNNSIIEVYGNEDLILYHTNYLTDESFRSKFTSEEQEYLENYNSKYNIE